MVFLLSNAAVKAAPLAIGEMPTAIKLEEDDGGKISGGSWSSDEITKSGKIISLFYVDPEERRLNEPVEAAYDALKPPVDKHASFAVINMAAAWYPNYVINTLLKNKQAQFPQSTYVKDLKKVLVREWGLKDDSVNLVIFGKDGKPLLIKQGPMNAQEVTALMQLLKSNF